MNVTTSMNDLDNIVAELEGKVYEAGEPYGHGKADCEYGGIGTDEVGWYMQNVLYCELRKVLRQHYLPVIAFNGWEAIHDIGWNEVVADWSVPVESRYAELVKRFPALVEREAERSCRKMARDAIAVMFGEDQAAHCDELYGDGKWSA